MAPKQKTSGWSGYGHASIPLLFILFFLGASAWGLRYPERFESVSEDVSDRLSKHITPHLPQPLTEVASSSQPQATGQTPGVGPISTNSTESGAPESSAPESGTPESGAKSDIEANSEPSSASGAASSPAPASPSGPPQSLPQAAQSPSTQNEEASAPTSPSNNDPAPQSNTPVPTPAPVPTPTLTPEQTPWEQKAFRGIYISRYQITNNASEQMIRDRVRHYRAQGINTIIHGVAGNGCTMYKSEVMQQTFGYDSCPNLFQDPWLDWLIDEAHKQGMQVHAYFEKGNFQGA